MTVTPHLPRRTVRLRLAALYGALFFVTGAALLGITYELASHTNGQYVVFKSTSKLPGSKAPPQATQFMYKVGHVPPPKQLAKEGERLRAQVDAQHRHELHQLLIDSGIALAIMTVVSAALGWFVAGRVLDPLRTMTSTTRRISERNLHERLALQGPDDELKELGDTIDGLLARLEAAFTAQRRFVANASHELRTPLAMMRTSLDVATAKRSAISPQVTTLAGKLREGLDQAEELLESFLTLARAEHGALPDQREVAVAPLVARAIDARRAVIAENGIDVHCEVADVLVRGSEALLARVVGNLIDNAVRHNVPGGWIRVEARVHGAGARVSVANGGARLREDEVRELAQPFRRLRAERTGSANGVGLGLSIVAAIAAAHAGRLELYALAGGGMQATVELPHASGVVADASLVPGAVPA